MKEEVACGFDGVRISTGESQKLLVSEREEQHVTHRKCIVANWRSIRGPGNAGDVPDLEAIPHVFSPLFSAFEDAHVYGLHVRVAVFDLL